MIGWGQVTGMSLAGPFELKLYLSECHKRKALKPELFVFTQAG